MNQLIRDMHELIFLRDGV